MTVEELLNNKMLDFRPSGNDFLVGCLNPDHEDSNPSMRIDRITGVFNCLSCGFSGNIYKYFDVNVSLIDNKALLLKSKIRNLYRPEVPFPDGFEPILKSFRGISVETLKYFEAFKHSDFEDRIVFPIRDDTDKVVGFQGRHMYSDADPKYVFYPRDMKVDLFPYSAKPINNSIILVEGFFDMLNLYDKGLTNVVTTFGTGFGQTKKYRTQQQNIERLLNFKLRGVSKLYIMYDGDKAGREASGNLISYLEKEFMVEEIELEDDIDPGALSLEDVSLLKKMLYGI